MGGSRTSPDTRGLWETADADAHVLMQEAKVSPLRWPMPTYNATFAQGIIWFVNNQGAHVADDKGNPVHKPTTDDYGHGYGVIKAFRQAENGSPVEIEDSDYSWLVDTLLKRDGPAAFRSTYPIVKERFEQLVDEQGDRDPDDGAGGENGL